MQLPESGLDHMVLLHHQAAIPHVEPGQAFYLLSRVTDDAGQAELPVDRFIAMLDRATAVPLYPPWAAWLFRQGIKRKLIEPLPETRGVEAWRIGADSELWLALIEHGIQLGALAADQNKESQ